MITILTLPAPEPVAPVAPISPRKRKKRKSKMPTPDDTSPSRKKWSSPGSSKDALQRTKLADRRQELANVRVISAESGETFYKCSECPRVLTTPYNYFAHKRLHTNEGRCICDTCGKSFSAASSLTRHVRDVHAKIKDFKCAYCERKLASKVARDEHQRTHTDERPHVCETCGKTFRQRASLSVHKRFHSKHYMFNCSVCNRGFPRKQDMERHQLTHTDQKPYGCKQCDKTFRSSASAIRHRQTHVTSEIKQMCDVCGESFVLERHLKSHIKKLHKAD